MGRSNMWVSFLPKRRARDDWAPVDTYGNDAERHTEEEDWESQATELARDFDIPGAGMVADGISEDD